MQQSTAPDSEVISVYPEAYSKRSHAAPKAQPIRRKLTGCNRVELIYTQDIYAHQTSTKTQRLNLKTGIISDSKLKTKNAQHMECNKREPVRHVASYVPDSMISSPLSFFGIVRPSQLFRPQSWIVLQRRRDFIFCRKSPPRSPHCSLSQVGRANCALAIETNVGKPCAEPS